MGSWKEILLMFNKNKKKYFKKKILFLDLGVVILIYIKEIIF